MKRFKFEIYTIVRVMIILGLCMVFGFIFGKSDLFFSQIIIFTLIILLSIFHLKCLNLCVTRTRCTPLGPGTMTATPTECLDQRQTREGGESVSWIKQPGLVGCCHGTGSGDLRALLGSLVVI